jgi:hypothetical protein
MVLTYISPGVYAKDKDALLHGGKVTQGWGKVYSKRMSNLPPAHDSEPKPIDDNARKLVLLPVDPSDLAALGATTYDMEVQWTDVSDDSETKVVCKRYDDPDVEPSILRISKETVEGKRKTRKGPISFEDFLKTVEQGDRTLHLTKRRSEFGYVQGDVEYALKYDEFKTGARADGSQRLFCMLEVEAETDEQRERFDPHAFTLAQIYAEATGSPDYTGYRIIQTLQKLQG